MSEMFFGEHAQNCLLFQFQIPGLSWSKYNNRLNLQIPVEKNNYIGNLKSRLIIRY